MTPNFKRHIGAIFCASLLFLGALWLLAEHTMEHVLERNAVLASESWTQEIVQTIPGLPQLVLTETATRTTIKALRQTNLLAGIYRFKLYSRDGKLVFDTGRFDPALLFGAKLLSYHNSAAASVVQSGNIYQEVGQRDVDGQTQHFVETYMPFVVEGITIGTIETYVDVTKTETALRKELGKNAMILMLIAALGCWLPLGAYLWRSHESERAVDALKQARRRDHLTGLENRNALLEILEGHISANAGKDPQGLQLDILDIDHFQKINDLHGTDAGDALLKSVGISLGQLCVAGADVFRLSGDEFAILTWKPSRCDISPGLIHQAVGHPLKIRGKNEHVSLCCSIGTARWPEDASDARELLANAETARFIAKLRGRNRQVSYDGTLRQQQLDAARLQDRVRQALEADEFSVHFQPYFADAGSRLAGFEALLRMTPENGEAISPSRFVPILEEAGLIAQVGRKVLFDSCKSAMDWPEHLKISVNVSLRQFEDGDLPKVVSEALDESGLPAKRLELEITESLMLDDDVQVLEQLNDIRALGVGIAIDDFGAGYSSLGQLWRFPIDKLKVDRSFIIGLENGTGKALEIVKSVVCLGHALDLTVTVEGVETKCQSDMLARLGVDYQQGFLHGRPMPQEQANTLILRTFASLAKGGRKKSRSQKAAGKAAV